ncbi:hypothetical protein IEQ34_019581 [Dendrobium chrysotoxum]|uniref:Rab-GAP TBC domain-containing protein n=1 Tax=Dendrobium chrysotoxum TaxID=161865 RepID=A0AAV7G9T5_DENCH|nr:hypothetical protein IEQ34_019581 [Dendrobium chrysotoxum]
MKALRRSNTSSSSRASSSSQPLSWIHLRSLLIIASSTVPDRGNVKSPWSQRKRQRSALSRRYWNSLFAANGRLRDGGIKFLKKARNRGIDPSIRSDVWPFLLGVYDLNSSEVERNAVKVRKRIEYEKLRIRCRKISNYSNQENSLVTLDNIYSEAWLDLIEDPYSPKISEYGTSAFSLSLWSGNEDRPVYDRSPDGNSNLGGEDDHSVITHLDVFLAGTDSSDSDHSVEILRTGESYPKLTNSASLKVDNSNRTIEDFRTWQRIVRLDAIRADPEWVIYSPTQAGISEVAAKRYAKAVGLKDFDHLEPCMIYHASRLVAALEAYAIYDPEIGYCQGMSDLLSPILTVIEDDCEAFWCFVGFMKKARHNFRLDELGIRRQLAIVSRIIRSKDAHLYQHLEQLQAEDCFFVYRLVLVLFRRELTFEQTVCLWEVMWADQAAIRAGIGRSAWGRMRLQAPPTDDLLLYAIAAFVLQRRKLIIERYSSMDEIMKECNSVAGKLDVWRLLDDAHDLVVTLHDKIQLPLEIS